MNTDNTQELRKIEGIITALHAIEPKNDAILSAIADYESQANQIRLRIHLSTDSHLDSSGITQDKDAITGLENKQSKIFGSQVVVNNGNVDSTYYGVSFNPEEVFYTFQRWSMISSLGNSYQIDEIIGAQISILVEQIEQKHSYTRIVGAAGDGKTRMILEAIRLSKLKDTILYVRQPNDIPNDFLGGWLRKKKEEVTLIVDEVDDQTARTFLDIFSTLPSNIRLVLIGIDASKRLQSNTFHVQGGTVDLLKRIINDIVPGLPSELSHAIARDCEPSPKLTVLVAQQIHDFPELIDQQHFFKKGRVLEVLDRYLAIQEHGNEWKALSTCALLMRIGWSDDVEEEADKLFRVNNLDPTDARRYIIALHERFGIAPQAGRYRYISPAILADHLAVKQLRAWTRTHLARVFGILSPEMAISFAQRIRRVSTDEHSLNIVQVILGADGPFRHLSDLESSTIARVLRYWAGPLPYATLNTLRRIISTASVDDLRAAGSSRREMVWALEELLWRSETFEVAAELLLKLALAENEPWGNNATHLWIETFQPVLGRTEAGIQPRAHVLRQAAQDSNAGARSLAAQALAAALKYEQFHRGGQPPKDVAGMPTETWEPATWNEWNEAARIFLSILTPLLCDEDHQVRQKAVQALEVGLSTAMHLHDVIDAWIAAARTLIGTDYTLRSSLVSTIVWTLETWEARLAEGSIINKAAMVDGVFHEDHRIELHQLVEQRLDSLAKLTDELRGNDFSSHFRFTVAQRLKGNTNEEIEQSEHVYAERLEQLVRKVIAQPELLESEWGWLREDPQSNAPSWIYALGKGDESRIFASTIVEQAISFQESIPWVSFYELGYTQCWAEPSFLDQQIQVLQETHVSPTLIFDMLYRAGYSSTRLEIIKQGFIDGSFTTSMMYQLAYGGWGKYIPPEDALSLVLHHLPHADNAGLLIPFVATYLRRVEEANPLFRETALRLLLEARPSRQDSRQGYNSQWGELAKQYVDELPYDVAKATVQYLANKGYMGDGQVREVMFRAWEIGDQEKIFQEILGPALAGDDGRFIAADLAGLPLNILNPNLLLDWVAIDPLQRIDNLVEIIRSPGVPISDLPARLLEQFPREAGSAFSTRYRSGAWVGSYADWVRSRLEMARQWLSDERTAVRQWASNLIQSLEHDLQRGQRDEEESRFRW